MEILKQPLYNPMPVWKQAVILYVATSGLLSNVALEKVNEFVQGFVDSLQANQPGSLRRFSPPAPCLGRWQSRFARPWRPIRSR